MADTGSLKVTARGEREIVMMRVFNAPRRLVFEAFTRPELLKRWLGVFGGWSLAVCEIDLRVGGRYRWIWRNVDGSEMGVSGMYREVVQDERIVTTERFDQPWYPGEAVGTVEFTEEGGKTTLTQTLLYESREARDGVLKSPMEHGLEAGYKALDGVLSSLTG
ncbi:MAG TPA: SRPBCC family protein [Verrucomicrobiae bacterium]|nr:SRPBCC family protein [Verrucomicrobiae bacterium]